MIKKVPIQWFVEVHLCDQCREKGREVEMLPVPGESYQSTEGLKSRIQCPDCGFPDIARGIEPDPQWERVPSSADPHFPILTPGRGGPAVEPPKPPENPPRMPQDRSEQAGLGGMVGEKQVGVSAFMAAWDAIMAEMARKDASGRAESSMVGKSAFNKGLIEGLLYGQPPITEEEIWRSEAGGTVGATGGQGGDKDTPNPDYFTLEDNTITGGGFMGRYEYVEIQKEGKPVRFWRESTGGIPPTQ